jgi:hypothetical protein
MNLPCAHRVSSVAVPSTAAVTACPGGGKQVFYAIELPFYTGQKNTIQDDKKYSVHLMITIQKVTSNVQSAPRYCLAQSDCLAADRQGQGDTRLTLTPSAIHNSNYVIMESDWNSFKYFCVFLYCNQVHRDFLITLYKYSVRTSHRTWCEPKEDQSVETVHRNNGR